MANLKDIKFKIVSVTNTQKTTKAMKLVSSAKLTRTRQLSQQSKGYASKINSVLSKIALRVNSVQDDNNTNKAFLRSKNLKTLDIVFVTADKGLCGGFNMATIKAVNKLKKDYESKDIKVRLRVSGRKGSDYFSFSNIQLEQKISDLSCAPDYDRASGFIKEVVDDFYKLIDSLAAEHSARMQAMETATKNAKEKVESLTIEYNKARQAAITTELIEIISGVESLK